MQDDGRTNETQPQLPGNNPNRRKQAGQADAGLPVRPRPGLKARQGERGRAGAAQVKRVPFPRELILRLIDRLEKE